MQAVRRQITESATIVTAARGIEARRGKKPVARQEIASRRRIIAIGPAKIAMVDGLERIALDVLENTGPELNTVADRDRIGVLGRFFGHCHDMQPAEHDSRTPAPVPIRELVGSICKRQVNRNGHELGKRIERRRPL